MPLISLDQRVKGIRATGSGCFTNLDFVPILSKATGMTKPSQPPKDTLPLVAAAATLHVHHNTLRRWRAAGRLTVITTASGRLYVPLHEIRRLRPRATEGRHESR